MYSQRILLKVKCSSGEKFMVVSYAGSPITELIGLIESEFTKHSIDKALTAKVLKFSDENDFEIHSDMYSSRVSDIFTNNDTLNVVVSYALQKSVAPVNEMIEVVSDNDATSSEEDDVPITKPKSAHVPLDAEEFEDFDIHSETRSEKPETPYVSDNEEECGMEIVVKAKPNGFDEEILRVCRHQLIATDPIKIKTLSKKLTVPHKDYISKNFDHFTDFLKKFDDVFEIVEDRSVCLVSEIYAKRDEILSVLSVSCPDDRFISVISLYKDLIKTYKDFLNEYSPNFPSFLKTFPKYFEIKDDQVRALQYQK